MRPGDELTAIDGHPASERLAQLRRYISASTEGALTYTATSLLPHGPHDSTARFTFRRPDGSSYDATLTRSYTFNPSAPSGKAWRVLSGNIGYVDLTALSAGDVNSMMAAMNGTRGLILDMRGYPAGDTFSVGRWLAVQGNGDVALFHYVQVNGGVVTKDADVQNIGKSPTPYRGKTAMLIDERAFSYAEHTALICEAVAGTTFVGSPTAGANGNITAMVLPGANYINFTGLDVRHLDGRQLQRVGIIPDVPVPRTIAAIAQGRDEVLEKAIELITH